MTDKKMQFIMNALEDGWTVKKREDRYVFVKKHENRREVFEESYLENFILTMATPSAALASSQTGGCI